MRAIRAKILAGLIETRYPVYAEAELQVLSTSGGMAEDVAADVVKALLAHDETLPPERRFLEPI